MQRDPEDVREFLTEGRAYLDSVEPILAQLQQASGAEGEDPAAPIAAVFRAFHSIKGVAGFLSFGNVQEVTHKAEETLDRVRAGKLVFDRELGSALLVACDFLRSMFQAIESAGDDVCDGGIQADLVAKLKSYCVPQARAAAEPQAASVPTCEGWIFPWLADAELHAKFAGGAAGCADQIEGILVKLLDAPTQLSLFADAAKESDLLRLHTQAFGFKGASALLEKLGMALRRPRPEGSAFEPAELSVLFNAFAALKSLLAHGDSQAATTEQGKVAERELQNSAAPAAAAAKTPAAVAAPRNAKAANAPAGAAQDKNEIRVSLDKLDKMVDLIEELGVISTGIVQAHDGEDEDNGMRQAASKLRQITEELQEITVSIRMVPLATLFRKMIRLVGDVSGKLGKKARLEIAGEETELDKDAVEALQDPLVHMLRNCVDHGLEMPGERERSGKPEIGTVRLQAWHSGGEAWISISDDGRGISKEKVFAKAVAQGLVAANAVLEDSEILAFIFHPGFSLAKEVTEFSGRGVGMDVVKKNIESLKGRVSIESKAGEGSTFLIRLPMANALTESMLVRVGASKYVLRVASIRETFRPELSAVNRLPGGEEIVNLRGQLYPVIRLHLVHAIKGAQERLDMGLIIIVENRGRRFGLFVDEVMGKIQAVIKTPPTLLRSAHTLAGCSIIGTGSDSVALALDINALDEALAAAERK